MKQKISLDEFLNEETTEGFLCTIEPVKDSTQLKLTPWVNEQEGCKCESALAVERDHIESVAKTEHSHICCGKRHTVVEVFLKEGASISVRQLLTQSIEKATKLSSVKHSAYNAQPQSNYYHPFHQPLGTVRRANIGFGQVEQMGCGFEHATSGVCTSGCQCHTPYQGWYCCSSSCCEL